MLPTLLEGEALAVWLELEEDDQSDYEKVKDKLISKLQPAEFVFLDAFHHRKMRPDESPSLYLHRLKQLLDQTLPNLGVEARKGLLKHQFISGLSPGVGHQLKATGATEMELDDLVDKARLLMTIDEQASIAAIRSESIEGGEVKQLQEQVAALTYQVAALTVKRPKPQLRRCFVYQQPGHLQYECPNRRRHQSVRCSIATVWDI